MPLSKSKDLALDWGLVDALSVACAGGLGARPTCILLYGSI